jgi:transposase
MRFEEAYEGWQARQLTQEEAARLLGVCERTFRRYIDRYEEAGLEGLIDKRLEQISQRLAPVDEVLAVTERYRRRHLGWNVKHFYGWYRRGGGGRSYSWVKNTLQGAGLVTKAVRRGVHTARAGNGLLGRGCGFYIRCPVFPGKPGCHDEGGNQYQQHERNGYPDKLVDGSGNRASRFEVKQVVVAASTDDYG